MPRFFMAGSNAAGGVIVLSGEDAEHVKVLRMKLGEKLIVCDGEGTDHRCHISRMGDGFAEVTVDGSEPTPSEPSVAVSVLCGLPKGERADYIVQKCTETGAAAITFFLCERCVARPDEKSLVKKTARWQKIAGEAAKQSGRGVIPEVSVLGSFAEALDAAVKAKLRLFMYETGERETLRETVEAAGEFSSCAIITGPEGGFEKYEADLARAVGLHVCAMGPRILRCETAPVCAVTAVMYATGNL